MIIRFSEAQLFANGEGAGASRRGNDGTTKGKMKSCDAGHSAPGRWHRRHLNSTVTNRRAASPHCNGLMSIWRSCAFDLITRPPRDVVAQ